MHPTILSLWVNIFEQTEFFNLGMATDLKKQTSKFKSVKLCLKLDLLSYL